jgi:hypothetical protein
MAKLVYIKGRFSMIEMFRMFNLELSPDGPPIRPTKNRANDYSMEIVRLPLWKIGKRRIKRERFRKGFPDFLRPNVSIHPAGSKERMDDLQRFYDLQRITGTENSPFE